MQKAIGDLIKEEYSFFIPYYQRGYRWGKSQVYSLLNDLLEFHRKVKARTPNYQYYSLQPLVIKYDKENNNYRIIDGQQRLTTVHLILSAFEMFAQTREKLKFKLFYDREDSEVFLKQIKNKDFRKTNRNKNIDFYYMSNAFEYVLSWIEENNYDEDYIEKFMNFIREASDNEDDKDINQNIRFIWYQLPDNEDEFDTFIRLNIGKIPLTNAELIKSFIIQNISDNEKRFEVSKEWDDIEYALNNNELFGFLTKEKLNTRIELLFKLLLDKKKYKEFELYDGFLKTYETANIKEVWDEIKEIFFILIYWFENREFYHLIGYLIAIDENIIDMWQEYNKHNGKNSFKKSLIRKITRKLKITIKNNKIFLKDKGEDILLLDLYYKHPDTSKILLLFNILTLVVSSKDSYIKFSFDLFNEENWSIEHINPQTDKIESSIKNEKFINELRTLNNDRINDILVQLENNSADIKDTIKELEAIFSDAEIREDKDNIKNLTLLSSGVNSSLKNNFFPIKRKMIIDKDKGGNFIPIATKNLFLKYHSDFTREECNMLKWTTNDGKSYLNEMEEIFIKFLEGNIK